MYNAGSMAELEKKYSTYIKKRWLKFFLILILILLILFYFILQKPNILRDTKELISRISGSTKIIDKQTAKFKDTREVSLKPLKKTVVLKDRKNSLNKNSALVENNLTIIDKMAQLKTSTLVLKLPIIKIDKREKEKKVLAIKKSIKIKKTPKQKIDDLKKDSDNINDHSHDIKIETKNIDEIVYLNDKFNEKRSIKTALLLCEKFYKKKDFENSLKWSMIANDIDNTSEESWIWFAKSKYKLNKKSDAIKALKAYLSSNNSNRLRSLLEAIEKGKLNE